MSFYDTYEKLCQEKGVKPGRAAQDCGINRSNVSAWKNNGYAPRGDALKRIADYFGVTTDYLLGLEEKEEAPAETGKRSVSDEDIKFALFGGDGEITDEMYEEVKQFASMVKLREQYKKKE